jgi:cytochrome c oxidase subunit 3
LFTDKQSVILYALVTALSAIFLASSAAFVYTRFTNPNFQFSLPIIFHANTAIILASSFALMQAIKAQRDDNERGYLQAMGVTFLLGTAFLVFQTVGWVEMHHQGMTLKANNGYAYVYVISGLHFLHVLGGLGVMSYSIFKSYRRLHDPVQELLFSTDPNRITRIRLLATYWHFVDVLWVYLYVFFLVNALL